MIHVAGKTSATILGSLRKASATGNVREAISLVASDHGEEIATTGHALREALERYCGPSLDAYVEWKARATGALGDPQTFVRIPKKHGDATAFLEAMLGLKGLKVSGVSKVEERFGTEVEDAAFSQSFESSTVTFEPEPVAACRFLLRRRNEQVPLVLEGKAFVASVFNASPKEMMARFSCHAIDVICRPSVGKVDYEVRFRRTLEGHSLTPAEWRDFHGACAMIGRSDALLEIGASGKSLVQLDLGSGLPANVERHEWFARVAHRLERLNDATGRELE